MRPRVGVPVASVLLPRMMTYHIAAPRTLGELRKSYHKKLSEVLRGEIPKDLTGHAVHDIETTIAAA